MPALRGSKILISNHTSPLDIFLMFVLAKKPLVFIGKSSLAKIPIFGFFFKRTSILVDRADSNSRLQAFKQAKDRLEQGLDVCIFPEGGIPEDKTIILGTFKSGAFRLSVDFQIPIVPIAFLDCKKRLSYTFFSGSPGILNCRIHPAIKPQGCPFNHLKKISHQILYENLTQS